jgi:cation transport regulator ChaB
LIRPYSVIPDSFRDLFKKAVISTQPPLDVSKIPNIAGAIPGRRIEVFYYDAGTTVLWFFKIPDIAGGNSGTTVLWFFKIPDIAGGDSGTTDALIRPYSVIPGLPRDLLKKAVMSKRPPYRHPGLVPGLIRAVIPDLFRDLFKKAVISTQPPLDVSKIPDIAGGDSGTTDGNIAGAISGRRIEVFYYDAGTTHSPSSRTRSGTLACPGTLVRPGTFTLKNIHLSFGQ